MCVHVNRTNSIEHAKARWEASPPSIVPTAGDDRCVSTRTSAVNAPMRVYSDTFKCVNTHVVMKNEVTHASW